MIDLTILTLEIVTKLHDAIENHQIIDLDEVRKFVTATTRRSIFEMRIDILQTVVGEDKITRIMNMTNMNWKALNKILKNLEDQGFVWISFEKDRKDSKKRIYITPKGETFLKLYKDSLKFLEAPAQKQVIFAYDEVTRF